MEGLITNLQSSDIKVRAAALEAVLSKLRASSTSARPFGSDCKQDVLIRFMSNCVSILKDANPKLIMSALDCTQQLMDIHSDSFTPLLNMTFELLFSKYSDSKLQIRTRATEVMVSLLNMLGLSVGFEKLSQHIGHKNFRVKEHILFTILLLHNAFGDEVVSQISSLPSKISILLSDQQATVRQLAVDTLAMLHTVLGDSMLVDLEMSGVRILQLRLIQDAIRGGSYQNAILAMGPLAGQSSSPIISSNGSTKLDAFSFEEAAPAFNRGAVGLAKTTRPGTLAVAATMPGAREKIASSRAGSGAAVSQSLYQTMPAMSSASHATGAESSSGPNMSMYHPSSFIGLLNEGAPPKAQSLYSEKDLIEAFKKVTIGLMKNDDWQLRTNALLLIQGIALGDGSEFEGALAGLLRGINDSIITQIGDLRSSVSKEACRTVATLARTMGTAFAPFAELWIPALMKQVVLKIHVMASAADRSIRIILATTTSGFSKCLPFIMEQCASKTPSLRKNALEYMCLCCAIWKTDVLDKLLGGIKQTLRTGVSDADAGARKTARHLFWVLRCRPQWQHTMDLYLQELDPISQKHIHAEVQTLSPELVELLDLLKNPVTATDVDHALREQESAAAVTVTAPSSSKSTTRVSSVTRQPQEALIRAKPIEPASLVSTAQLPVRVAVSLAKEEANDADMLTSRPRTTGALGSLGSGARRMSVMAPMRVSKEAEEKPAPAAVVRPVVQIVNTDRVVIAPPPHAPVEAEPAPKMMTILAGKVGGAQRVIRPVPKVIEPEPERRSVRETREPASSAVESSDEMHVNFTPEFLRNMAEDAHWGTRLKVFEAINQRLQRAVSQEGSIPAHFVELVLDLAAAHMGDAHQRVAAEVLAVVGITMEQYSAHGTSRLGAVLTALFHRLADRRTQIRDCANQLLNSVRVAYDPVVVIAAVSPKIPEIPERMKTAVMQFLGVIAPHCGAYFSQPQNTWAFLGRMAAVLGGIGTKPSATLFVAGKRLLELVYNTASSVVVSQIATMPLQQQTCLKRMLENVAPDIDSLVATASRSDWSKQQTKNTAKASIAIVDPNYEDAAYMEQKSSSPAQVAALPNPQQSPKISPTNYPPLPCEVLSSPGVSAALLLASAQSKMSPRAQSSSAPALPSPVVVAAPPTRDIMWLLQAMRPTASHANRLEAVKETKRLVRTADDSYWSKNCAQVINANIRPCCPQCAH